MSFYEVQLFIAFIVFVLRKIIISEGAVFPIHLGLSFNDCTAYFVCFSWLFSLGYYFRGRSEENKDKALDNLHDVLRNNHGAYCENKSELDFKIIILQDKNDQLQKSLERFRESEKETEKKHLLQTRSALEVNQEALQSFL